MCWVYKSWPAFLVAVGAAGRALAAGALPLYKDPSVFAALSLWGVPANLALAVHVVQAALAVILTAIAWRRPGAMELKVGLAVIATLIVLPYLFDYDLMTLAVPVAVGLKATYGRPAPAGTRIGLVVLAVTPILVGSVGRWLHVPIGPRRFVVWLFHARADIGGIPRVLRSATGWTWLGKQANAPQAEGY